jgi:quinol monooxygenase YgiN
MKHKRSSLKLSEEILNKKLICRLYLHTDEESNNNVVVMFSNFADENESKLFIENFKNDYDEYKEIDEINIGETWTIH